MIPPRRNADFVAAMEDVLDVYHLPYDAEVPVVCMDETNRQLVRETRKPVSVGPGRPLRIDYEYERAGTANLFLFTEPLRNWRRVDVTATRTRVDWALAVRQLLDVDYPDAVYVILVLDNLNTHTVGSLYEAFGPAEARRLAERLEIHYTPKHGSWLNVAEIELKALSIECLDRRIPDKETLSAEVGAWQNDRNQRGARVDWRFTTENARVKRKRLYPQFQS